jgi:CheY-like chemotaxis protein
MSKTILLADDSVTIQKVVELSLMDDGHKVVAFSNGDDALARLAAVQPDLVIADIHMPGANGYEVARQVKASAAAIPVLLLVGTFEPFDQARFDGSGADAFMRKPFDSQELSEQVAKLLRGGVTAVSVPTVGSGTSRASGAALDVVVDSANEVTSSWAALPSLAPVAPRPASATPVAPAGPWEDFAVAEFEGPGPAIKRPAAPAAPAAETGPRAAETTLRLKPVAAAPSGPAVAAPAPPAGAAAGSAVPITLSEVDIDRICRRVLEVLSEKVVREITWEVVPDLAEVEIKNRIRELESQVD